jgi:hypothetical protein
MPSFAKLDSRDPLYFLTENLSGASLSNYCIAFLPNQADLSSPLTLAETWTVHPGVYLFLNAVPANLSQVKFVQALRQLLNDPAAQGFRFIWLENPGDPLASWRLRYLAVVRSPQTSTTVTRQPTFFNFRNFSLFVAADNPVTLNAAGDGFVITRLPENPQGFHFATGFDANRLSGVSDTIALPFQGEQAGCLQFDLTLQKPSDQTAYAELAALESGLYLCFKDPNQEATDTQFGITSLRYPFLAEDPTGTKQHRTDLTLYPSLDPVNPLAPNRTYLGFVSPKDGRKTIEIPSYYRTNIGYTVHLTPQANSRLVFAELPSATTDSADPPFCLVPSGDFVMTVPAYPGNADHPNQNLLCAISGVEYIRLNDQRTNILSFHPGQAAFAPGFVPGLPLKAGSESAPSLTDLATTAWAYVWQQEGTPTYFAQPDQAVLHRPKAKATTATAIATGVELLQYMEVPTAVLPPPQAEAIFPLFPYGGVQPAGLSGVTLADYQRLEQQVLSPLRRAQITQISAQNQDAHPLLAEPERSPARRSILPTAEDVRSTATGTTPQGFLATFTDGFENWQTLLLAQDTSSHRVQFKNIERQAPLRSALQSNQLLLVITDPKALKPSDQKNYFPDNQLTIQNWTFDLDPDNWAKQGMMMIFKFYDKPLIELIENPQMWSNPAVFSGNAAATRDRLSTLLWSGLAKYAGGAPREDKARIEAALVTADYLTANLRSLVQDALNGTTAGTSVKDYEHYKLLANAALNVNWSGILALNVNVPPSNLPPELLAISASIDETKFFAQYVGIETTPITPTPTATGTELVAGQSSLFALIDYQDDTVPPPTATGYNFQVNSLMALFQNSQLKAFSSEVTVILDRLFDERTQLLNDATGRNIVVLKGTAENHDGKVAYAFSFSGDNHFVTPDSRVLNEVEIIKAQLATDPIADLTADTITITGRFTFWGRLNFKAIDKFDAFSFGAEPPPKSAPGGAIAPINGHLSFSNLVVTMSFQRIKQDKQVTLSDRQFAFLPGNLVFDLSKSPVRQHSLYAKFPLKLTGLLYSDGKQKPSGYLPVKTPLGSGSLPDGTPWYGLTFELDLGGLGALSGATKFVTSLLLAWTPVGIGKQADSKIFVGLKMPGLAGDVLGFPLQSVIKLAFKSVELAVTPSKGDRGPSYLLKLKNIVLKLFVLSFPQGSQTELIIFGDPQGTPENRTVGWYAAYAKNPTPAAATAKPPPK